MRTLTQRGDGKGGAAKASRTRARDTKLFSTKNDLPADKRV